jgi:hypothetical protein
MKLMVEIDGQTLPLARCFWVRADSRGCVYSSLHGDQVTHADEAHKQFVPRQRDRDREIRQGYTIRLITREQWKEQAEPCFMGHCKHRAEAAS